MPLIQPKVTPDPTSGTFPAEIRSYELRTSQRSGNEYFNIQSRVEQGGESYLSYGIVMNKDRDVARFFHTCGLPEEAEKARRGEAVDWDKVIGARVLAVTETEEKPDGRVFLNTKTYLPLAVGAAV